MIARAIIILSVFVASSLQETPFHSCGDGIPTPIYLEVSNCDQAPCPFYMNYYANTWWNFTTPYDTTSITPQTEFRTPKGLFRGFLPLPIDSVANGCQNAFDQNQCPLQANQPGSFKLSMYVPQTDMMKNTKVDVKLMLKDDNNRIITCHIVSAKIQEYVEPNSY